MNSLQNLQSTINLTTIKLLLLLSSSSFSPLAPKDDPKQRLCSHWKADEFIKGCPGVQPLAVRVEGLAAEP